MSRYVKNGIQITLGILRAAAFTWCELHHYVPALRLLAVLLFNFPDFMHSDYNTIQEALVSALEYSDADSKEAAQVLLRAIIADQETLRQFNCEVLFSKIVSCLTSDSPNYQSFDGLIE
jgi:hypothetical protein